MTNDDRQAFSEALAPLADVFRVTMTEGLLRGYWKALEDLPLDTVERGCVRALRYEDRFPPPATIRQWSKEKGVVL